VPASVPLFVTIDSDLDSSQWQQVDALANKFPDKQKAIDSFKGQLQKKGLDWEQDVKPALGPELDVVMLDLAHPDETVGLLQPKDQGAFERLVKKGNTIDPSSQLRYHQFHGWTVVSESRPRSTRSSTRVTRPSTRFPRTGRSRRRWAGRETGSCART
jgi:hypothetical protein